MPAHPLQTTCLAVICGTPALASIFVGLRLYTRRKLNIRLGWDDWLIVLPLLLSIALIGPSWKHVKMWHVGVHIWEVPPNEIEPNYDDYYAVNLAFNLLNIPILPLVKASIILLLLRAGSVIEWLKKVLYGILIFTVGSAMVPWFLYIFTCPPQTGNTWKPRTFGGLHCMGRHRMGEMLIWVTCANLLTDLLIFPIPFIIVRRMMSARLRSRLVVLAVFTSSLAVAGIGAAKIYLSYRDRLYSIFKPDWTYPIDYCINHIENNVAIIIANIPILRGLVTRWVFNFRTKATPIEREEIRARVKTERQWSTSQASTFTRVAKRNRFARKIMPCVDDDFSSSLARSGDIRSPDFPPKIITSGFAKTKSRNKSRNVSRKQSRQNSVECFDNADSMEKGDCLETVRSIGSLGSAPTLVGTVEWDWKNLDGSPVSYGRRISSLTLDPATPVFSPISYGRRPSSPILSPITPLAPCVLREEDDDEIYPHP
ncbi:hypothetical protein GQ43DRAFT_442572 [Delitschia confertaspora ATCC 74209]|uniref:Rhodopsin domain-containing protein n=1 Tax=Delitschia confertaspora ATCC 74209 TaxID=1513339 RepID=A0A9P4JMS3_9PLEO|nr:hypothetical protein GQ43DRAFT_442572 [Delitschia confertaspora ATCC 74209]